MLACLKCGAERRRNGVGLLVACDPCNRARTKAWREANPEKATALRNAFVARGGKKLSDKRYYLANKEKWKERAAAERGTTALKEKKRREYEKHRGRYIERAAQWAKKNPERALAHWKAWAKAHPDVGRATTARRRARLRLVPATLTSAEWLQILVKHEHSCAYCQRSDVRLEQDHVIPISRGGWHAAENIVPACRSCNARKAARLLPGLEAQHVAARPVH